jgi:glycosyltransferase involved in cell wall biosynthesis
MRARVTPKNGDVFLGLDLSTRVVTSNNAQLAHWRKRGVKLIFVVYDLLPVLRRDWFTENTADYYQAWLKLVTSEADHLACISNVVASDLLRWMDEQNIKAPQVTTLRLGGSIKASLPSPGLPPDYKKTLAWVRAGACVMMVGTIEPRKGYDQALAAFEELWGHPKADEDLRLLIVGRPGWDTAALQQRLRAHRLYGDRLLWIHDASDEYLELMYDACWGILMASHGEGFGLPLLEAAAHCKPALVRDLPVFREIGPTGAAYFEDGTALGLAKALRQWRQVGKPTSTTATDLCWSKTASDLRELLTSFKLPKG